MVTITNGKQTIAVTNGAYEGRYKSMGYKIAPKKAADKQPHEKTVEEIAAEKAAVEQAEFVKGFVSTPKANWSKKDMKSMSEIYNVDITANTVGEAKNNLEAALKAQKVME